MKTNLFRVKKVKKKNITLEEEQLHNPLLLLYRRYGCFALLFFLLIVILLIITIVFTILNLLPSKESDGYVDEDLAFEFGDNNVVIGDSDYDNGWVSKYANVYKKEGIIFVVESFEVDGNIITYYSDGSSKLVRDDGSIVRVSALEDGSYGIDSQGRINTRSKRKGITVKERKKLKSGTVIVYYSDGSAEVTKDDKTILVRNSDRINTKDDDYEINDVVPSGSSYPERHEKVGKYDITYYTDGSVKVDDGENTYVVRKSEDIEISGNDVTFPNHNEAKVVERKVLKDGTIVTYYSDGSALVESFYDTDIMVRRSGHIILDGDESFYEILEGEIAFAVHTKKTPSGDEVTYYDDGSAVVRHPDGTSEYIPENSDVKFDDNGNIKSVGDDASLQKNVVTTPDGDTVTQFENGKSRVETSDGDDYIVDSKDVIVDTDGNLTDENGINKFNPRKDDSKPSNPDDNPGGITGNIETLDDNYYSFSIKNPTDKKVDYMLVLEEVDNYEKYGYQDRKLFPNYIKYDLILNNQYFEKITLDNDVLNLNNRTNYILYRGSLEPSQSLDGVMLYFYIDYTDLDNSMQDHMFVGTLKLYINQQ